MGQVDICLLTFCRQFTFYCWIYGQCTNWVGCNWTIFNMVHNLLYAFCTSIHGNFDTAVRALHQKIRPTIQQYLQRSVDVRPSISRPKIFLRRYFILYIGTYRMLFRQLKFLTGNFLVSELAHSIIEILQCYSATLNNINNECSHSRILVQPIFLLLYHVY